MFEKQTVRKIQSETFFKILKATAKAMIVYVIYFPLSSFLAPFSRFVPRLMEAIEVFVAIYIMLMITSDVKRGTVFSIFSTLRKPFFLGDGGFRGGFRKFHHKCKSDVILLIGSFVQPLGSCTGHSASKKIP